MKLLVLVKDKICSLGYDPAFGARPLKRCIQKEIEDRLAMCILSGDFAEDSVIHCYLKEDEITFS